MNLTLSANSFLLYFLGWMVVLVCRTLQQVWRFLYHTFWRQRSAGEAVSCASSWLVQRRRLLIETKGSAYGFHYLLSAHADRQDVDISFTVCLCMCLYGYPPRIKLAAFYRHPRHGISHFGELCSPRSPKSDESASLRAMSHRCSILREVGLSCVDRGLSPLMYLYESSVICCNHRVTPNSTSTFFFL